ncbi:MAG TPA: NADPH:quinone oxidoreductase family protein [Acidimicrobiales bacterium]|nr:NADPH:quinone oxidoreductase family protein [Acidimicrobiales bacterium]
MRAVRVHAHGEPADVARVEDTDAPEPGPGQVVIAVGGAALNLPDVLLCRGTYALHPPLPFTPGLDVAGTVVAVGEGTDPSLVGRAVAGVAELPYGALAERSLLAADRLYPVPEGVSAGAAAAMLIAFTTAHVSLIRRAGLVAGETLLVLGGAGGVGTAAIQVGKVLGARVVAAAGSPAKAAACLALGADAVVDTSAAPLADAVLDLTGSRGADVVFDPVGGAMFDAARKCTASEGRLLVVGFAGGVQQIAANLLLYRNQSVLGVYLGAYSKDDAGRAFMAGVWDDVMRWHADGKVHPVIDRVVGLDGVATALTDLVERRVTGKVVVQP